MRKIFLVIGLALMLPRFAFAHAFGQLYNLPVPFWLYLYGGAAAIIVSFLIIGYFFNKPEQEFSYKTFRFMNLNTKLLTALKIVSVFLFLLTIVSGLFGKNRALTNFNMTFFWIIFLLGLTYLTAIIGNIYSFINPWKILLGRIKHGILDYPKWLSYYPALLFYFILIWLELVAETDPKIISSALVLYTLANILGVFTFGKTSWFQYGELFSVFFRLIGKISPIESRDGKLYFRPPFLGLLKESAEHFSLLLFILFMLSSTAFDGFRETLPWVRFYWNNLDITFTKLFGEASYEAYETFGLLLSPLVFLSIYLLLIGLAKLIAKSSLSFKNLSLQFALTLVPIALVYNIAHYYTLIFTEAPNIIRLVSDPFAFGWNVLGTASFYEKFILSANFVWHSQVGFILLGHIASVYLAHLVALRVFPSQRKAIISQLPMLMLMVAYTMIGLWILSQPLTGGSI